MAILDEIDSLATCAKNDLDDLLNFGRHIDDCWALAKKLVDDIALAAKRRLSRPASP